MSDPVCVSPKSSHPRPCHSWVFQSSLRSFLSWLRLLRHRHHRLESDSTRARLSSGVDRLVIWPIRLQAQLPGIAEKVLRSMKEGGRREEVEAVDHGRRKTMEKQSGSVMQLSVGDFTGKQHERRRRPCDQRGNIWSGLDWSLERSSWEQERKQKRKKCYLRFSLARRSHVSQTKTSRWHRAYRIAEVEDAYGSSSRQDRARLVITLQEGE